MLFGFMRQSSKWERKAHVKKANEHEQEHEPKSDVGRRASAEGNHEHGTGLRVDQ